jgi:phage shock protein A
MAGLWDYIRTLFGQKVEEMKDPEVEIEQAIQAAHRRDEALREQAAKVLAHRTRLAGEIEDAAEELAKAKELAKQALLKADAAQKEGNAEEASRWNRSAQALAMRMQAAQSNYDLLQQQLLVADDQADQAKSAVMQNAMQLQEITAKRMEMLGQLETAKMQESVNEAMRSITSTVGDGSPSLKEVEDKIEARMAEAQAKAELQSVTPEGSMAELEREVDLAQADTVLDNLRAELGLAPAGGAQLPPASSSTQLPPASS